MNYLCKYDAHHLRLKDHEKEMVKDNEVTKLLDVVGFFAFVQLDWSKKNILTTNEILLI